MGDGTGGGRSSSGGWIGVSPLQAGDQGSSGSQWEATEDVT